MEATSGSTASSSSPEVGTKSAHWGFTIGGRVYRVPRDFQHPGGRELMDRHDGTDIEYLFRGTAEEGRSTRSSHVHSGASRRLLEKFAVVPMQTERGTREQGEEDRGGPCTLDAAGAGRVQVVNGVAVDLDRPLVLQVGALLDSYQVWVHKPELGKPRFFQSEVLEQLSKTKWWVVPFVWLPVSLWLALVSYRRLRRDPGHGAEGHLLLTDSAAMASCYLFGVLFWSVVEYAVHRFMFHVSTSSYWPNTLHFLFHGCHHKFPMDDMRLVMPPAGALPIVLLVYIVERYLLGFGAIFAPITLAGTLTGYVCYDMLHYHCHFSEFVKAYAFLRWVRRSHMDHHYRDNTSGFGISSPAWDLVLGTQRKEGKGARGTACKSEHPAGAMAALSSVEVWEAGVARNVREDGRERTEFRRLTITEGVVDHAMGSAQVDLGDTKVLAVLTLELGPPRKERPRSAIVNVSVDCMLSSPVDGNNYKHFDAKGRDIARRVEQLYDGCRGAKLGCLDLENDLCVSEGSLVWHLNLDCVVISDDGSLLDCVAMACRCCLRDATIPGHEVLEQQEVGPSGPEVRVEEDPNLHRTLSCGRVPTYVSVGVLEQGQWVFDLSAAEELRCRSVMHFGVDPSGSIRSACTSNANTCVSHSSGTMADVVEAACLAGRALLEQVDASNAPEGERRVVHLGK